MYCIVQGNVTVTNAPKKKPQVIPVDKQQLPLFYFNIFSSTVNKGEL